MATDFLGNELSVGDDVVFVNYNGTSADLERGTITKIFPHQATVGRKRRAEYKFVKLPAALAKPVRHGHWIAHRSGKDLQCSECEWSTDFQIVRKYCPNCGTKMDETNQ